MSQLLIAFALFGTFVVASFAWYGYRQAHMFWKWSAMKWAKALGISGLAAFVGSASIVGFREWRRERAAAAVAEAALAVECARELNRNFQALMAAAEKAERAACVRTGTHPNPLWVGLGRNNFQCGRYVSDNSMYDKRDAQAPLCNTRTVRKFSCGTTADLDRLLAHCGLYEEKK